jgi:hypothetical protein
VKTFAALVVASLVAATLLTFACAPYLDLADRGVANDGVLIWLVAFIVLSLASFTIGLLLHTAATRTKRTALPYYLGASVLIGAGLAAWQMDQMLSLFFAGSWSALPRLGILALGAGVGATMGTSFWLIRRPDRNERAQ